MATRFYFPASTAADVSPAFNGAWSTTSKAVRRKCVATKGSSAITIGTTIDLSGVAGNYALDRQYVSDPLAAQTILAATTVHGSVAMGEFEAADNIDATAINVFIVSNDGATLRGELLGWNAYGTFGSEFSVAATAYRNVILAVSATFNVGTYGTGLDGGGNLVVQDGDRLVIEIGAGNTTVGSGPNFATKWGENATDLPADDETTTTDGAGWLEISQTLTFQTAGTAIDPMGAMGFFGI